jgi:hypothetical protein
MRLNLDPLLRIVNQFVEYIFGSWKRRLGAVRPGQALGLLGRMPASSAAF